MNIHENYNGIWNAKMLSILVFNLRKQNSGHKSLYAIKWTKNPWLSAYPIYTMIHALRLSFHPQTHIHFIIFGIVSLIRMFAVSYLIPICWQHRMHDITYRFEVQVVEMYKHIFLYLLFEVGDWVAYPNFTNNFAAVIFYINRDGNMLAMYISRFV